MTPDQRAQIIDEMRRLGAKFTETMTRANPAMSDTAFERLIGEADLLQQQITELQNQLDAESWPVHRVRPVNDDTAFL